MIVELTNQNNPEQRVEFRWDENGEDCVFVAFGLEEELGEEGVWDLIDDMAKAKADEGADFDGWTTDLIWE